MATVKEASGTEIPSGYANEDTYYATRYEQGGRKVYDIDLSLLNIAATLPRPDPTRPTPGNRRVKEAHARGFARYVREKGNWGSPAPIPLGAGLFSFPRTERNAGTEFRA